MKPERVKNFRMLRASLFLASVVFIALLGATACSQQPSAPTRQSPADDAPASVPSATPKPAAPKYTLDGTASFSEAGYSISVQYVGDVSALAHAEQLTASEGPGNVALQGQPRFTLVVTNTTPGGHDVGFSDANYGTTADQNLSGPFTLEGVLPAGSGVCGLLDQNPFPNAESGYPGDNEEEGMAGTAIPTAQLAGGCDFVYAFAFFGGPGSWPNSSTLGVGQTAKISGFGTIQPVSRYSNSYTQDNQRQAGPLILGDVPSTSASAVAKSLANPEALVIVYDGNLIGPRGVNPPPASCRIIASSSPTIHC